MEVVRRVIAALAVGVAFANLLGPLAAILEQMGAGLSMAELLTASAGLALVSLMTCLPYSEFVGYPGSTSAAGKQGKEGETQ